MKSSAVALLIIVLGVVGTVGVWTIRYNKAFDAGFIGGLSDGNKTGFTDGYNEGYGDGTEDGYSEGYGVAFPLGRVAGNHSGYQEGYTEGLDTGYSFGFDEGNLTGIVDGYISGIKVGSEGYDIRDPTFTEAIEFIESDDTDELFKSGDYSYENLLGFVKKNAYVQGYRLLWVNVEMVGTDSVAFFTAFNTTDKGILVFSYRHDIIMDLKLREPCYDRDIWIEPSYDDTITKIEYTP